MATATDFSRPLHSRLVLLPNNDIDTDQIIPARFLKGIDKAGLGDHLFHNWRYHEDGGNDADFPLNQEEARGAAMVLAGDNFGCGSSREHAVWALSDWGIRVVIATSFADIFRNNALNNGLVPVAVDEETHGALVRQRRQDPSMQVTLELAAESLSFAGGGAHFPIDPFAKRCLLSGIDKLGYLLTFEDQISAYEARPRGAA